jgi:anti-sigma-K factor RskA
MSGEPTAGSTGGCGGNAAPYVLGALTDDEHRDFLLHLETCSVCRDEVAALRSVASTLPSAVPQVAAPTTLKRRVMSEVRREAAARRSAEAAARPRSPAIAWGGWRRLAAPAVAALAVIALVVTLVTSGSGGGRRVVRAELVPSGASGVVDVRGGHAVLMLSRMPQPPRGRVYEVWVKRTGAPEPTDALFAPTASGRAAVDIPGVVTGVRQVLVTAEPLGGSRVPTRPPQVVARLS